MNFCSSCKAPLRWAQTVNGRSMPLDAEPLAERPGNMLGVFYLNDEGIAVHATAPGAGDRELYINHFATCRFATSHRRRLAQDVGTRVLLPNKELGTVVRRSFSPTRGEDEWTVEPDDQSRPIVIAASSARVLEENPKPLGRPR